MAEYITYGNKIFKGGIISKNIIQNFKKGKSSADIAAGINYRYGTTFFTSEKIEDFLKRNNIEASYINTIKFKHTILNPSKHYKVLKELTFLFNKKVFASIILLLLALLLHLYNSTDFFDTNFATTKFFIFDYVIIYLSIFLIMILHEYGHVVAALKYGIVTRRIGFGIYFIFPVLYADLTKVWKKSKEEKLIINLGGMYFQLISIIFLIILFLLTNSSLLVKLITVNFFIMVGVLNPFFKYDGYWVYSDLFDIPNLRSKSVDLIKNCRNKKVYIKPALKIYTILLVGFFLFQSYLLIIYTKFNVNEIMILHTSVRKVEDYFFILINVILNSIFLSIIFKRIIKYFFK
jgi:putative peptide zinc metalloprotease protein